MTDMKIEDNVEDGEEDNDEVEDSIEDDGDEMMLKTVKRMTERKMTMRKITTTCKIAEKMTEVLVSQQTDELDWQSLVSLH